MISTASLWKVTNRVAFLGNGVVVAVDSMTNLVKNPDPLVHEFFQGARGRIAEGGYLHGDINNGN
jgi:phospholipid/cholesterol/gamma-HCH transport system ATP-binding protein